MAMKRKGVLYDVGCVSGVNWRPDYAPALVHREPQIIETDLHCSRTWPTFACRSGAEAVTSSRWPRRKP